MKKEKSSKAAAIKTAIINQIKRLIVPVILCAIILAGVYVVVNYEGKEVKEDPVRINGYEGTKDPIVLESNSLKLTMDPTNTQISVEVKSTGKVWYSNPQGVADDASILLADREKLQSTVLMTYGVQSGLGPELDSFKYSAKNGTYAIETGEDYIRVDYSMGDIEREYVCPPVKLEADFVSWLDKMSKENRSLLTQYYKKYDINNLSKADAAKKDELLASYPIMETEVIYALRSTTKDKVKVKLEQVFADAGYTYEEYLTDKELNLAEATSDKPVFNLSMIYRLQGDELVVEVPLNSLDYKEGYPIYSLTPLPYFGAGGAEDEGFLLVPEGGGGLINFNNGKTAQSSYYSNMYGWDMALSRPAVVHNTRSYFNAFGVSNGDDSFICILDEGVAYAAVQADVAGKNHSYNFVNTAYTIANREKYDVGDIANSDIYVYQETFPDESLTQRYRFVDSGNYVDMAKNYQEYLVDTYAGDFEANTDAEAPMAVELVGAVDKVRQIMGMPVSRPLELTTFEEAEGILNALVNEDGIKNLSVKLTGWCNGGVNQKILKRVNPISALGGKKDLQSLSDTANALGVDLYLEGVTQYEFDSTLLNGFFSFRDAAKRVSKDRAEQVIYSDITYAAREGADDYYLLHTDLAHEMLDNLTEAANKYGTGIAPRDTGKDLSSDFYRKDPSYRNEVMNEQSAKLKELSDAGTNVMINMGNDYAVAYSDMVTNMELKGSEYSILDDYVPFYQLAIHGFVNYTGYAINGCGDDLEQLLRSAEYGAGLQFMLMDESAFALQKTLYTEYYGAQYDAWHDRMMEIYNRYNSELGHTFNQQMVAHESVTSELSCTTYADGTKVYVNYSYEDIQSADGAIPARDYKVIR